MTTTFNLPDLGEGLPEAEIVTWHVAEGDTVKTDDLLVSVETAKAVVEVPSPHTGVIGKLHAAEVEQRSLEADHVDVRHSMCTRQPSGVKRRRCSERRRASAERKAARVWGSDAAQDHRG